MDIVYLKTREFESIIPKAFCKRFDDTLKPEDNYRICMVVTADKKYADVIIKDIEAHSIFWRGLVDCKMLNNYILIGDSLIQEDSIGHIVETDCNIGDWDERDISLQFIMKILFSCGAFRMNRYGQKKLTNVVDRYIPMKDVKKKNGNPNDAMICNGVIDYIINNISTLAVDADMDNLKSSYKIFCPSDYIQKYIMDYIREDFVDVIDTLKAAVAAIPTYRLCWLDMLSTTISGSVHESKDTENSVIIKLNVSKDVTNADALRFEDTFMAIGMEISREYIIYHNEDYNQAYIIPQKMIETGRNLIIIPDNYGTYNSLKMQFIIVAKLKEDKENE